VVNGSFIPTAERRCALPIMPPKKHDYDESKIKTLSSLEHIRTRTGMYIGRLGDGTHHDDGIYILLKEVIDNSVDEFIMGYGRQIDSTILETESALPGGPLEMVFIRAPRITKTAAPAETLATRDDYPVLVREGHILAATFHPELGHDTRVHQLFLDMVRKHKTQA